MFNWVTWTGFKSGVSWTLADQLPPETPLFWRFLFFCVLLIVETLADFLDMLSVALWIYSDGMTGWMRRVGWGMANLWIMIFLLSCYVHEITYMKWRMEVDLYKFIEDCEWILQRKYGVLYNFGWSGFVGVKEGLQRPKKNNFPDASPLFSALVFSAPFHCEFRLFLTLFFFFSILWYTDFPCFLFFFKRRK